MKQGKARGSFQRAGFAALLLPFALSFPLLAQHGSSDRTPDGSTEHSPGEHNSGEHSPGEHRNASNGLRFGNPPSGPGSFPGSRSSGGQHLPQWFAQHQNLTPNQQENALRREQGFTHLPEDQQQQIINRLHRLDMEPPAQRQRIMERNERFEALPPERQQEIRGASQALGQMPPDRRQAVRQAFRDLRNLPLEERQNALNSARFSAEYSPSERTVLGNLLSIEPYHPQ